jgi:peptide/nickel transport system substrate-binding protein
LSEPAVRRALRLAIDRHEIIANVRHGIGLVQDNPISPAHPAYDKTVPTAPFDIAAANRLLEGAGWKRGPDGIRAKNGRTLNFAFASSTGTPATDEMIELIRPNWQKIGLAFTVRRYPSPLFFASYANGGIVYGGKWDLTTFQWGGDPIGDLSNLYACDQIPPHGQNDPHYCDPAVSAAMAALKEEYDPAKRQRYANIVQAGIARDAPIIVLDIPEDLFGYNSDLKGFHPNQLSPFDDAMNIDI